MGVSCRAMEGSDPTPTLLASPGRRSGTGGPTEKHLGVPTRLPPPGSWRQPGETPATALAFPQPPPTTTRWALPPPRDGATAAPLASPAIARLPLALPGACPSTASTPGGTVPLPGLSPGPSRADAIRIHSCNSLVVCALCNAGALGSVCTLEKPLGMSNITVVAFLKEHSC